MGWAAFWAIFHKRIWSPWVQGRQSEGKKDGAEFLLDAACHEKVLRREKGAPRFVENILVEKFSSNFQKSFVEKFFLSKKCYKKVVLKCVCWQIRLCIRPLDLAEKNPQKLFFFYFLKFCLNRAYIQPK
jgi:hypothetical protein